MLEYYYSLKLTVILGCAIVSMFFRPLWQLLVSDHLHQVLMQQDRKCKYIKKNSPMLNKCNLTKYIKTRQETQNIQ